MRSAMILWGALLSVACGFDAPPRADAGAPPPLDSGGGPDAGVTPDAAAAADAASPSLDAGTTEEVFTSALWGLAGERWTRDSRLPDFSHAGYHHGEDPPRLCIPGRESCDPRLSVEIIDVTAHGAVADDAGDDIDAFRSALAEAPQARLAAGADYVVVYAPPGRYRLGGVLTLEDERVVLAGAAVSPDAPAPRRTVLELLPLRALEDNPFPPTGDCEDAAEGCALSFTSMGGVVVMGRAWPPVDDPAELTRLAPSERADGRYLRGERSVRVADVSGVELGDRLLLRLDEDCTQTGGSLSRHLHGGSLCGAGSSPANPDAYRMPVEVVAIEPATGTLTFDRPLATDVDPGWDAWLSVDQPTVREAGLEHLTLRFPALPYAGHHDEPGANAVWVAGAEDVWLRSVRIENADSGVVLSDTRFTTVEDVVLDADRPALMLRSTCVLAGDPAQPIRGHHGLGVRNRSSDNLFRDYRIDVLFCHDQSLASAAHHNAFTSGRLLDGNFDHHGGAVFENLFSDVDVGAGTRVWASSGSPLAPKSGARTTLWNVRAARRVGAPPQLQNGGRPWGRDHVNVIGVEGTEERLTDYGAWMESRPPDVRVEPPELSVAQRLRRLTEGYPAALSGAEWPRSTGPACGCAD